TVVVRPLRCQQQWPRTCTEPSAGIVLSLVAFTVGIYHACTDGHRSQFPLLGTGSAGGEREETASRCSCLVQLHHKCPMSPCVCARITCTMPLSLSLSLWLV